VIDSYQIKLPADYYFGVTAASADTPDTYEVYKFVTTTSSSIAREEPRRNQQPPQQQQQYQQPPPYQQQQPYQQHYEDTQASQYTNQEAQFADLHNRLQIMAHAIDNIQHAVSKLSDSSEGRHQEIARNVMSGDQLNAMDQRIQGIERTVRDYQKEFSNLQSVLKDTHGNLMQSIPAHMTDSK
jgi:mannose-binding lectin 1